MRPPDPPHLGPAVLGRLGDEAPGYDRDAAAAGAGTVHLGLGAFARGHLAIYAEDLLAAGGEVAAGAGIVGASLRSGSVTAALEPQAGLYTEITSGSGAGGSPVAERLRVIGSVVGLVHGEAATVNAIAAPGTRAVTLTITEKGYRSGPTAGVLVEGLARRRAAGLGGLAVVSCDNVAGNGRVARSMVLDLAERRGHRTTGGGEGGLGAGDGRGGGGDGSEGGWRRDTGLGHGEDGGDDLAAWIAEHVRFPSSVVDRIVPATTDADRRLVLHRLGVADAAPVRGEAHRSWVIERAPGLPAWDRAGALLVDDVTPWERRKLRTVNGPHSALAYLGALAGLETIDRAASDPALARFVAALVADEVASTLEPPLPGAAAGDLARATLVRFADASLGHRCRQVAADGSQKLRQRIGDPLAARVDAGEPVDRLALVLGAWMAWVARCSAPAGPPLVDPLAERLVDAVRQAPAGPPALVDALLAATDVLPAEAADEPAVRTALIRALALLDEHGPRRAAELLS